MKNNNVLVLGAGISGLTTAYKLLQAGYKVTIWSKEASGILAPTSANAYAFWMPWTDVDPRCERWGHETFAEFKALAAIPGTGVIMRQVFDLKTRDFEPWYAGRFPQFRHARPGEIPAEYKDAHVLDPAPVIDPPIHLAWLRKSVLAAGAQIIQREVSSLAECTAEFSLVVNSTGLGARQLCSDTDLHPVRLQVVRIRHNGFDKVMIDSEGPNKLAVIVPHADYIKIGAIYDERDESMLVDDAATLGILERCAKMVPGFKADAGDVLSVTRCLRPKRSAIRVELDKTQHDSRVIHNYGHNGSGYIVSYGSAAEVVAIAGTL